MINVGWMVHSVLHIRILLVFNVVNLLSVEGFRCFIFCTFVSEMRLYVPGEFSLKKELTFG